jgi:predicted transcriptional regulator
MPETPPLRPRAEGDGSAQFGPLEATVLRAISDLHHPVTVRDVCDALPRRGYFAYQGVLNCMNRLASKGVLHREKRGNVYVYAPVAQIDSLAAEAVSQLIGSRPEHVDRVICRLLEIDPERGEEHIAELRRRVRRMKRPRRER